MAQYISLDGNRRLINVCRAAGLELENPRGQYNGYGYERLPLAVVIYNEADQQRYDAVIAAYNATPKKATKRKTPEEIKEAWCVRLAKLTDIDIEEAREIADEKLEYKQDAIDRLNDKQVERYSSRRQKIINAKERENPLRRIENEGHADAIIAASNRHRYTQYDYRIEEAKEMVRLGEMDASEIKDYARTNMYNTNNY